MRMTQCIKCRVQTTVIYHVWLHHKRGTFWLRETANSSPWSGLAFDALSHSYAARDPLKTARLRQYSFSSRHPPGQGGYHLYRIFREEYPYPSKGRQLGLASQIPGTVPGNGDVAVPLNRARRSWIWPVSSRWWCLSLPLPVWRTY